jgi:methionyl-tRNA formyltransferase
MSRLPGEGVAASLMRWAASAASLRQRSRTVFPWEGVIVTADDILGSSLKSEFVVRAIRENCCPEQRRTPKSKPSKVTEAPNHPTLFITTGAANALLTERQ